MFAPFRRVLVASILGLLALPTACFAQAYGLTQRPTVAPYLDGVMPPQPPSLGGNWSTVVAFPNLSFLNAMGIVQMPGQNRMVVWEREGRIYWFDKNAAASVKTLVADLSANCQGWDDSGLMGIAFHPQFNLSGAVGTNRYLFAWYTWTATVQGSATTRPPTSKPVRDRLVRLTLDANGVMVPGSETVFIDQNGNNVWHNGGGMFFHPDNGFLYITNGDDANTGNSQQITGGLFSGVIRIDVDKRGGAISHAPPRRATGEVAPNWPQYFIPSDNPFVGVTNANEEMFAIGLRSPHRMTIDPLTKRIFIGDVGAGSREEVTIIEPNDPPGLNLQWSTIEGLNGDLTPPYIGVNKRPNLDYGRSDGAAVIGGYVYRGAEFAAELGGRYIFADNITNSIWVMDESTVPATKVLLTTLPKGPGPNSGSDYTGISSFGVDAAGELYLCQLSSTSGKIYKLQRGGTPGQPLPATLSATGAFNNTAALTPSGKLIPYGLNQPFWSDRAVKTRWAVIPNTADIGFTATGEWTWPEGSVFVKHFELPVDDNNPAIRKRLETRLLVKMASGATYGATYKWRADNSEADLLDSALTENVPIAITPVGTLIGQDIGGPTLSGSTTRVGDVVTIQASGADIWNAADQFHFAHQQRTGDFDISVRMESLTQADLYAKAGLMARESLGAGSRHVYAMAFPSNAARNNNNGGFEFQYRTASNGTSLAIYPAVPQPLVTYPNTWLRLRREGDTFIGYSSVDGVWWAEFARHTLDLPDTIFFGLAVTSHTNAARTTAKVHLQNTRLQPWYYPSRNDCVTCHNPASGGVLGPKTRQLNGNFDYPGPVTDNQLRSWAHIGLFNNPPTEAQIPNLDKLAALNDGAATLEKRARSYLDANCASCHRPGGVQAFWDARFDTPLTQQGILYGTVVNNLGDPSARVVVPQDLLRSIMHLRVNTVGANQMPPLARNMIDQAGADVLAQWINSLTPNTPPNVALTSPADGAVFLASDTIPLSATASDADGIQKVEFYDGAFKIGEDTTAPYEFAWLGAQVGNHQVRAAAVDNIGNSNTSATITINVQSAPLPSPWLHQDVGSVAFLGDAAWGNNAFTINGSGDDIWGNADAFHFVYQPITGDSELIARVVSLENTDGWAKAGVMMRETLDAGSRHAFSLISVGNGAAFQRRATANGGSDHTAGPGVAAPYWVRLVRAGNLFSAYASPNGTTWTLIGTATIPMSTTIYAGLAVTSHNNGTLAETVISNVNLTGAVPTYANRINFQPAASEVPTGYLPDAGATFAARGNGFSYGWSRDNAVDARDRNNAASPDQRYDTFIHFQKDHGGGSTTSFWELAVPNAQYNVRVVSGDSDFFGETHHLTVEGVTLLNAATTTGQRWVEATGNFTVTDGRLTIAPGASAVNAKICFVEITSFDSAANVLPTIALTGPAQGATFYDPAVIQFAATASDPDGAIARVEFLVDGVEVGEDASTPFEHAWTPAVYGTHDLTARAVDWVGGSAVSAPVAITVNIPNVAGFRAEYYHNINFTNLALVRADANVNFDWGGGSPDPRVEVDTYSARWSGRIRPRYTETYTITAETDDGVRVWVNGQLVIDNWVNQGPTRVSATMPMVADQTYDIVMEYYEDGGGAVARLLWSSQTQGEEPIPASRTTVPPPPPNATPTIVLTAPGAGMTTLPGDSIALAANAQDSDGAVARVEFWADGIKLGEDLSAPYTWNWPGPRAHGGHSVHATVVDNGGASASTAPVTVQTMPLVLLPVEMQRLTNPDRIAFTIRTTLPAGRTYVIEFATDLAGPWTPLQSGTSDGSPIEITDITTNLAKRFYHVRITN